MNNKTSYNLIFFFITSLPNLAIHRPSQISVCPSVRLAIRFCLFCSMNDAENANHDNLNKFSFLKCGCNFPMRTNDKAWENISKLYICLLVHAPVNIQPQSTDIEYPSSFREEEMKRAPPAIGKTLPIFCSKVLRELMLVSGIYRPIIDYDTDSDFDISP